MADELRVSSTFGGYRIAEVVGRGGMGIVYRAIDVARNSPVALKVIVPTFADDPDFRKRFERESRLAAEIDHPNVVTVYEAGEHEGRLYLAMRYLEATELRALIATSGGLHPRRAAPIIAQVASALDAAHERGLVHRDVKPANVLVEDDGHAYLTDFGLSKHTASLSGLTRPSHWVGSADYAPPEQVQSTDTDARSDVYALGCVLFETLTGRVPFERTREVTKLAAHLSDPPPRFADAGLADLAAFDEIVGRAMAKDPLERYESAGELGRAVTAAASDMPDPPPLRRDPDRRAGVDRDAPTVG